MNVIETEPGFYGKLPIVGDFVSRRLPREFLNSWDSWLQSSIAASKEELGDAWLNSYLNSPIWRFVLSPGVCGNSAWAGILMPSVDKVGRYFPLTVATRIVQPDYLPYLLSAAGAWFERLEAAGLSGLEDGLKLDVFDGMVKAVKPVLFSESAPVTENKSFESVGKNAFLVAPIRHNSMSAAFTGLSLALLKRYIPGYSIWTNGTYSEESPVLLACEGLPPLPAYSGFLSGLFPDRGWNMQRLVPPIDNAELVHKANKGSETVSTIAISEHDTVPRHAENAAQYQLVWQSWGLTDRGKRREHNEDAILDRPEVRMWAVADGMGGHRAGDVASRLIVDSLRQLTPTDCLETYAEEVRRCIVHVNHELRALSNRNYNDSIIGSTVLVLIGQQSRCAFLWAGDSRLYRFRDNKLEQLTRDHSVENERSIDQAQNAYSWTLKQSNVITRAVGADDELELDCRYTDVRSGDLFLLSSDGLDKELSAAEIESILINRNVNTSARALLDVALDRGARDNVSVIIVSAGSPDNEDSLQA